MTFHVENLNVEELCQRITSGYSFCHVFRNNIRQKANFLYTNLIAIDVDDYPVTMEEFVDNCRAKPSLAYTTISDGRNGLSRFRLIYVFDHPIQNEEEYKCLYCQIIGQLGLQDNKDNCGSRISQLMNGNHRADIKTFCSNQILTKHILLQKCQLEYYQSSPIQYISNRQFCKITEVATNDDESKIISDLFEGPDQFLQKHSQVSIITETPLDYNTDGYAFFPDQFFKLIIRVDWSKQKPKVNKFKDGEGRRKRIFIDALIIRNIKPDATFLELLYNLVLRRKLYYDNSDGVLTNQLLIDDVRQVQQMDLEEVHALKPSRHGQFQTDPNYCALHGITRRKHSRTVRKWLNYISIALVSTK